jgi:hypothetical protein
MTPSSHFGGAFLGLQIKIDDIAHAVLGDRIWMGKGNRFSTPRFGLFFLLLEVITTVYD